MQEASIILVLLFLSSLVFFYFDFRYKKVPNIVSLILLILVIWVWIYINFFNFYLYEFVLRGLILFLIFYFLYIQGRVAWWDFKIYFVLSTLVMYLVFLTWEYKINWFYFDFYLIMYSLVGWFLYLMIRYIFLFFLKIIKKQKIHVDDLIKFKFYLDFKDWFLHFQIFFRILFYVFFIIFVRWLKESNIILYFFVIVFEFLFMWYVFTYLKFYLYLPFRWFFRKKEFKFFVYFVIFVFTIFSFERGYFSLILLVFVFSVIEYIVSILQLNFDVLVKDIDKTKDGEKLSFRNFWIDVYSQSLLEEIEMNPEVRKYLKNKWLKYVEIINPIPYWIFIILWVWYFIIKFLFFLL